MRALAAALLCLAADAAPALDVRAELDSASGAIATAMRDGSPSRAVLDAAERAHAAMREATRRSLRRIVALDARIAEVDAVSARVWSELSAARSAPVTAFLDAPQGPLDLSRRVSLRAAAVADLGAWADELRSRRDRAKGRFDRQMTAARDLAAIIVAQARAPKPGDLTRASSASGRAIRSFVSELAADPPTPPRPSAPGSLQVPVAGKIVTSRGAGPESDTEVERKLVVSAPFPGIVRAPVVASVRYAGALPGYGDAVMLEHEPGALILLAGLARATVRSGDVVPKGAVLGHLSVTSSESGEFLVEAPSRDGALSESLLYIETWRNGVPVSPARWFEVTE